MSGLNDIDNIVLKTSKILNYLKLGFRVPSSKGLELTAGVNLCLQLQVVQQQDSPPVAAYR